MPLTPEQQQAIRDEEFFRTEVRKAMAAPQGPPSLLQRLSSFGETKVGFWLLTTVLAGLFATGLTELRRHLDQQDIARREAAERSRRDAEMLLKLGPMLTSEKPAQMTMATVLLDSLSAGQGVDREVAGQIKVLFQSAAAAGSGTSASSEARVLSQAIYSYFDRAGIQAMQRWDTPAASAPAPPPMAQTAPSLVAAALDSGTLPVRLYIQIGDTADRPAAEKASDGLRQAGLIVPGIEVVPAQNSPAQNSVRYCKDKVSDKALELVRSATASQVQPAPVMTELAQRLCGNVRANHFELWYARR